MSRYFPFNYFRSSFSFRAMFKHRDDYKRWQEGLILFFTVGLMLFPMALIQGKQTTTDLDLFVPKAIKLIDDSTVEAINTFDNVEYTNENGQVIITNERLSSIEVDDFEMTTILFSPDLFMLKDEGRPPLIFEGEWRQSFDNPADLENHLSQVWFNQNQVAIRLTNLLNLYLLVFVSILIIWLGVSFLISLMRFQRQFHIRTFKQARGLVLNAWTIPTFLAIVVGLWSEDVIRQLTAHSLFLILNLMGSFWFTRFNDDYTELQSHKKKGRIKIGRD